MKNIFLDSDSLAGGCVIVKGDDYHYLRNVRRIEAGDLFHAVISSRRYTLMVSRMEEGRIVCSIKDERGIRPVTEIGLYVYQGLLKGKKMDLLTARLSELGVLNLVPLLTERSVPPAAGESRVQRWRKLAREGTKVTGLETVMDVSEPVPVETVYSLLSNRSGCGIILFSRDGERLKTFLNTAVRPESYHLFYGPEGGFTEEEETMLRDFGARTCSLGASTYRAETAALVGTGFIRLFHNPEVISE